VVGCVVAVAWQPLTNISVATKPMMNRVVWIRRNVFMADSSLIQNVRLWKPKEATKAARLQANSAAFMALQSPVLLT